MATKKATTKESTPATGAVINLAELLSTEVAYQNFKVWLYGTTPLITHAWSEKARREMLSKQVKGTKGGKEARDPHTDFVNSLYEMGGGSDGKPLYGFPVTGIKNAILSSAHKDKGIPRVTVQSALYLDAEMVRVRPALQGAICDMPLVRVYSGDPEMREDMVRIGSGLQKKANLAYRGQFTNWAIRLTGKFNTAVLSPQQLFFLLSEAGTGIGIGEWRNERRGMFGAFRMADIEEQAAWEKYAAGKGPLPVNESYREAAE
jgi:hypothetical protein